MKTLVPRSVLGAIAGAAMLLPLAAAPASAQVPGGPYLHSCRDMQMRGNRLVATCRAERGRWQRTTLNNIGRCVGGIANRNGRLVCSTRGGGFNVGSAQSAPGRDRDWRGGYGESQGPRGPGYDPRGGWGPNYYGR